MAVRVPFRLRQLAWLVSASLAATGTAVAAPAARVDFAIGGVTVTGADGRSRPVVKGLELQSGDRIVTAAGRAQLRFTDGAYVSVQPDSDFSIREYQFDGKTDGTEKGVFGLLRGALRTVTGAIGRVNRGAYQIQTPTATIGIRGTGGLIQILPDGSTLVTGNSGVWSLANKVGSVDVPAGKAAKAGPDQTVPPSESVEGPVLPPPQGKLETPKWPTESDALTAMPTGAPNSAPLFIPGPETVLVAGDNVTSAGLPASLFGPVDCSTA
ncbi:MAG: FecR family protein, partial [Burkholderiales bacterium]